MAEAVPTNAADGLGELLLSPGEGEVCPVGEPRVLDVAFGRGEHLEIGPPLHELQGGLQTLQLKAGIFPATTQAIGNPNVKVKPFQHNNSIRKKKC